MPKLSIIIPCYFNEENIPITTIALIENEKHFDDDVEIEYIFVDDASKDNTYEKLKEFHEKYPKKVKLLRLAKNVGSHNAIYAGMTMVTGDCCVFIAADLQDPPELIPKMYGYWRNGMKLVIANRESRDDGFFSNLFANFYHIMIKKFAVQNVPSGGFDLMLWDKQVNNEILKIDERNSNILYLMAWLGYDYVNIPYDRLKREVGSSKWTLSKKVKLFVDSFVAFSFHPIRAITTIGIVLGVSAITYGITILGMKLMGKVEVSGWSSLMLIFLFVSAFQMISLGVIGEYLWRVLDEVRNRPRYSVLESKITDDKVE